MPNRLQLLNSRPNLSIRVKLMLQSTHRSWFIRQIGFGHPYISGTENTLAWAWVRLSKDRYCGHARKRAHGLHPNSLKQTRVFVHFSRRDHFIVDRNQHGFVEIAAAIFKRMISQSLRHIASASNLIQHRACKVFFLRGEKMSFSPECLSVYMHSKPVYLSACLLSTEEISVLNSRFNFEKSVYLNMSVCKPHSIFRRPDQRPARSSSLTPIAIVQGEQPILRYPFSSSG